MTHHYGSFEGTIRLLHRNTAILRERVHNRLVACEFRPGVDPQPLRPLVLTDRRVVLYGEIEGWAADHPVAMDVDAFDIIPADDELPTFEDVRALGLRVPDGMTVEEMVNGSDEE